MPIQFERVERIAFNHDLSEWNHKEAAAEHRAEQIAFNADLNRYYKSEEESKKRRVAIDDLIAYKTEEYLNDQTKFDWLDDNFEIVDRGQVMRALRSLDKAIRKFNHHALLYAVHGKEDRAEIDAVFTALSNIQDNFNSAIEYEAAKEYDGSVK